MKYSLLKKPLSASAEFDPEVITQVSYENNNPDFKFSKQNELDEVFDQIYKRPTLAYDLESDPLYQQYRSQAINQGKLAMQDTIGQAVSMTGGYDNSYAQTVGNQAYQAYLSGLNDKVPELYQLAYDKHNSESEELYNKYSLLSNERDTEFNKYLTDYNMKYGEYRDNITDQKWITELMLKDEDESSYSDDSDYSNKNYYSDWDSEMWYSYFAQIRAGENQGAAEKELQELISIGAIPQNMVSYAAAGARGGFKGH